MAEVGIRELLESGVHFGHQTRRWNPKMRRFIHGERGGIYIIDLLKTQALLEQAQQFSSEVAHRGGTVLFVGTKKQARDSIKEVAENAGMPYVNHRWLGGLITNWRTMSSRIERLHELRRLKEEDQLDLLPAKERLTMLGELEKLYEREKMWDKLADVCEKQASLFSDKPKKVAMLQKLGILFSEKVNESERARRASNQTSTESPGLVPLTSPRRWR